MTTSNKIPPAPKWDLDSIFPGGSASPQYSEFRRKTKAGLDDAAIKIEKLSPSLDDSSSDAWSDVILILQSLREDIDLIQSFSRCLTSQNVDDNAAHAIEAESDLLLSEWEKLRTRFESMALDQPDQEWKKLLSSGKLKAIRFYLDEMRENARKKMPVVQESLALDLAVSGYHAWNRLYDKMAGDLRVDFEQDGESESLSLGQLATKMSDPDRSIRARAFQKLTEAWESRTDLAAMALNAQAGFRLALYDNRGWSSPLYEPLTLSRLKQESLDAMWATISQETSKLLPYIEAKKSLLGIDKYCWYDEFAPCGKADQLYTYDEAVDLIVDVASGFSTHMAEFFRMATNKHWVEAEDRTGKAGGAYCTGTGKFRQSRVFMTYAGTFENLLTLAHELGHAYHGFLLKDRPFFAREYPMTTAETASIFCELLVVDATLQKCTNPQEKLMLLDQKLQQPYILFADLQCRYLFDTMFYAERKKGVVSKDRLCEMMVEAQKRAYGPLLDESGYHPLFWASKMHFFITDVPFYNYPYTFGYLFAGGVYDRAKKEGSAFADKYTALLADTGSMTTEDVAAKHLGVDLTTDEFWSGAVSRSLAEVDEFVDLAESI